MQVEVNGIALEVEVDGGPDGVPLVLVSGFGAQLTGWDRPVVDALCGRGLRVVRPDNRDSGLSEECGPAPEGLPAAVDVAAGLAAPPYTLEDMAADVVGVLDVFAISTACVCGRSMGGMIAQLVALAAPERVASLVSVYSTTGARDLPGPEPQVLRALLAPPAPTTSERIDAGVEWDRLVSGSFPLDEERSRTKAAAADDRARRPAGGLRQQLAIIAAPDRTQALRSLDVPTLVIHGDADPLIPAACGRATAAAIPGARYVELAGMGHDFPPPLWDELTGLIADFALENAGR